LKPLEAGSGRGEIFFFALDEPSRPGLRLAVFAVLLCLASDFCGPLALAAFFEADRGPRRASFLE
jgi:hypothetical protein